MYDARGVCQEHVHRTDKWHTSANKNELQRAGGCCSRRLAAFLPLRTQQGSQFARGRQNLPLTHKLIVCSLVVAQQCDNVPISTRNFRILPQPACFALLSPLAWAGRNTPLQRERGGHIVTPPICQSITSHGHCAHLGINTIFLPFPPLLILLALVTFIYIILNVRHREAQYRGYSAKLSQLLPADME
jgi:hypothetical protein